MNKCFIIASMPFNSMPLTPDTGDKIICADAGLLNCERFCLTPHVIVGDFDSLGYVPQGSEVIRLPVEKDDTDTGFAIKLAIKEGFRDIIIYGALGGKPDHTFANIQLLHYCAENNTDCLLLSDDYYITAVKNSKKTFPGRGKEKRFSVFAIGGDARGVTLEGMRYPLENGSLKCSFPLGVSNSITADEALVEVEEGVLVVMGEYKENYSSNFRSNMP